MGERYLGLAGAPLLVLLAACAGPASRNADFDRHRYSQLAESRSEPGVIFFDVSFPPEYPRGDPVADQARAQWLAAWLQVRRLCPAGHRVMERRPFGYLEDNPARHAERWEVACLAPPAS